MKKTYFLSLIITLILLAPITLSSAATEDEQAQTNLNESATKLRELTDKADNLVEKPLALPDWAGKIIQVLTRFELPVTYSQAIIAIALILLVAVIFVDIMRLFSPFSPGTATMIGIIMTVIMSTLGMIRYITFGLLDAGKSFQVLEKFSTGFLAFWVLLALLLMFIINKVFKRAREYELIQRARREGVEMASWQALGRSFMDTFASMFKRAPGSP